MTTLDEIEAAARADNRFLDGKTVLPSGTILALTADLRACKEALAGILNNDGGRCEHEKTNVQYHAFKLYDARQYGWKALQNLKKWGL